MVDTRGRPGLDKADDEIGEVARPGGLTDLIGDHRQLRWESDSLAIVLGSTGRSPYSQAVRTM